MALIKCPDCGKMFSEYADFCPECGCPVEDAKAANRLNDHSLPQSKESEFQKSSIAEGEKQNSITVLDSSNKEIEDNDEVEVEGEDEQTHDFSKYYGYGILVVAVLVLLLIGLVNHCKSIPTASEAEVVTDTINSKEQTKEEQIIERANYIFKNIPDHSEISDVDKSVFTSSFREVLEKAFALEDELTGEDALVLDGIAYWYCGNDFGSDDGLKGISLLSVADDNAVIKVEYKNCGEVREHYMKLACIDGQWYCNDWDNKKEDLQRSMEHVVKNTRTEHRHMEGEIVTENNDELPCELDFDATIIFDRVYKVNNIVFKDLSKDIIVNMNGKANDDEIQQLYLYFNGKYEGEIIDIQIHELRRYGVPYDGKITIGNKELDIRLWLQE